MKLEAFEADWANCLLGERSGVCAALLWCVYTEEKQKRTLIATTAAVDDDDDDDTKIVDMQRRLSISHYYY